MAARAVSLAQITVPDTYGIERIHTVALVGLAQFECWIDDTHRKAVLSVTRAAGRHVAIHRSDHVTFVTGYTFHTLVSLRGHQEVSAANLLGTFSEG